MAWIRTIPASKADEKLRKAMDEQKGLYPIEYATPVHPTEGGGAQIVESHSLIPDALFHAFATFGALMSPELPLDRRQHEMITTVVSVTNRCVY
jgi:alkylhydroperoxidase family enzyme